MELYFPARFLYLLPHIPSEDSAHFSYIQDSYAFAKGIF